MRKNIFFTLIVLAVILVLAQVLFVEFHQPIPALKSGDLTALARSITRGEDRVPVQDLAQWIIQDKKDYLLVDARPREEYEAGHIDSATHIPVTDLFQNGTIEGLPDDRSIIVYSNGTAKAAQAVVVLRCAGKDAYSLDGGYNHWQKYTLTPESAGEAGDEALQTLKRKATAWYFSEDYKAAGGLPLGDAPATSPAAYTPPVQPVATEEPAEAPAEEGEEGGLIVEEGC